MAAQQQINGNNVWPVVLGEAFSPYEYQQIYDNIDMLVECTNYISNIYHTNRPFLDMDGLGLYRRAWRDALLRDVPDLHDFLRASKGKDPM